MRSCSVRPVTHVQGVGSLIEEAVCGLTTCSQKLPTSPVKGLDSESQATSSVLDSESQATADAQPQNANVVNSSKHVIRENPCKIRGSFLHIDDIQRAYLEDHAGLDILVLCFQLGKR